MRIFGGMLYEIVIKFCTGVEVLTELGLPTQILATIGSGIYGSNFVLLGPIT